MARRREIKAGAVLHGPMPGVDHDKFYIVAGVSADEVFVCSVLINSQVNPFIQRRPRLLKRRIMISHETYSFLNYDSYVNCAQPLKIRRAVFEGEDLERVKGNVIASGELSQRDIEDFFRE